MAYTLEQLSADIRETLKADSGITGKQLLCNLVSKALIDDEFVARHLTAEQCRPRKVLYEDPELGFCVCGHVYENAARGGPHDHGSSWAIYGLAVGDTEMTDWRVVKKGSGDEPTLVEPAKTYVLKPGDSHFYDVGVIHSPKRDGLTKLVRIEGKNLDHVQRSNIKAALVKLDGGTEVMSGNKIKRIDARALKAQLHDGGELALLDAREELPFGKRHLLMASCVPLSRLELLVDNLVPRRGARVIWCDDGKGDDGEGDDGEGLAARAAERMSALGYQDVACLDGGLAAWEAAGFRVYSGVHVPSKAFAEIVEHEAGTPWISVQDLQALIDRKADIAIYDSRSYEEYHNNSIPTAISVPGAELVYRFADLTPSPDTTVIVNCGGRTRSIIGAQSLINAGVRNKVLSLKDGTMAWHLAGLDVVHGATRKPPKVSAHGLQAAAEAVARVAARAGIPRIDRATLESWRNEAAQRSLYVLDVRSPEEYEAGHLRGARSAPGGQLVQETDSHIATWGARVVLVDDNGVRATMTASWLKQMGWLDIAVLATGAADGDWETGPYVPHVVGLEAASAPQIDAMDLRDRLAAGKVTVIDLNLSTRYGLGHIPGAWFAIRSRLGVALAAFPSDQPVVLTSPDGALAVLAVRELQAIASVPVMALAGGTQAWVRAGLPLEKGATRMADQPDDVFLSPRERGQNREDAMREYLTWEINLVNDMARDDDHRFRIIT